MGLWCYDLTWWDYDTLGLEGQTQAYMEFFLIKAKLIFHSNV
jgi:hypothetical protein